MVRINLYHPDGVERVASVNVPVAAIDPDVIIHDGFYYVHDCKSQKFVQAIVWDSRLEGAVQPGTSLTQAQGQEDPKTEELETSTPKTSYDSYDDVESF